jgi:hypothetical protein
MWINFRTLWEQSIPFRAAAAVFAAGCLMYLW